MEFKKSGPDPIQKVVFQSVLEDVPGGLNIDTTELKSTTEFLQAGAVLAYDESTRKANLVKTAELQADATNVATTYRVKKNHEFKVGNILASAVGAKAYAITAIDTSNADYDVLTVGTTLGVALTASNGVILFEAAAESASNTSAYKYTAKGILKNTVKKGVNVDGSIVTRGTVYERRLPFKVTDAMKTALTSRILFSQSF